jgi:hypothetical protein
MYSIANLALFGGKVLGNLAQGYCADQTLVGAMIAPVVPVACITGGIVRYGKEAFIVENTLRAQGTKPRTVNSNFGADTYTLEQHALGYEISIEDLNAAGCLTCANQSAINIREIEISNIQRKLLLGHEKEVFDLVTSAATYEATNFFATTAAAIPGALGWNSANSTPIDNVLTLQSVVRRQIGCRFNSIVLGASVYERLMSHPQIVGRIAYNTSEAIGVDVLKRFFNVQSVLVADAVADDGTGNLVSLFPDNAFLGYHSPNPGLAAVNLTASSNLARPSSFYTYMQTSGIEFTSEKYYDLTSNGDSADVVRSVAKQFRKVLPVGLGNTGKVSSAVYIQNVL